MKRFVAQHVAKFANYTEAKSCEMLTIRAFGAHISGEETRNESTCNGNFQKKAKAPTYRAHLAFQERSFQNNLARVKWGKKHVGREGH